MALSNSALPGGQGRSLVGWLAVRSPIFYGWWIILLCVIIINLLGSTFIYGFGVLFHPIQQETRWSTVAITFAFSLRSEVGAVVNPLIGFLIDRYGPQKMLVVGLFIMGVGFWWLSLAADLFMFYAAFAFIALGNSICSPNIGIIAVTRWFQRRRSRAISFLTAGTGMGGLTAPVMDWFVARYGWRGSLQWITGVGWVVGFPLTALLGDRPAYYGLRVDGTPEVAEPRITGTPSLRSREASPGSRSEESQGSSVRSALRSRNFWLLAAAFTLTGLANSTILALLVPALIQQGIQPSISALVLGALPLISVPARLSFGWWGDYADKRMLLAGCYGLQALGLVLLAAMSGPLLLAAFVVVFGLGRGGPLPLQPALQADYFGVAAMGTIQGLLHIGGTLSSFVGPVVIAFLVDASGAYQIAWLVLSGCLAASIPLTLALHPQRNLEGIV